MPLTQENHFVCGLKKIDSDEPDCSVDFYYDPGGPGRPQPSWPEGVRAALTKVVAVSYPLTGYTTFFCCDAHAILAIERGQHMPPLPAKITAATQADMASAKAASQVLDRMRGKSPA